MGGGVVLTYLIDIGLSILDIVASRTVALRKCKVKDNMWMDKVDRRKYYASILVKLTYNFVFMNA